MADFDVVVLGAGPGGYVAAIRASQLGLKAAVVEEKYWGGVCLNVGCIPSKALLKNAELAHVLTHEKAKYGIEGDASMSYGPTHARSRQVSAGIVKGVHFLMKKNKIEEVNGWGTLTSPTSMDVKGADGSTRSITFDNLIIATGSVTRMIPGAEAGKNVVTYDVGQAHVAALVVLLGGDEFLAVAPVAVVHRHAHAGIGIHHLLGGDDLELVGIGVQSEAVRRHADHAVVLLDELEGPVAGPGQGRGGTLRRWQREVGNLHDGVHAAFAPSFLNRSRKTG